jgi:hypothetical protein
MDHNGAGEGFASCSVEVTSSVEHGPSSKNSNGSGTNTPSLSQDGVRDRGCGVHKRISSVLT